MSSDDRYCRVRRSPIWQFFQHVNSSYAKCLICGSVLSTTCTTANLKRHLRAKHVKAFEDLEDRLKTRKISVASLIALVQSYPCLWDTYSETYKNQEVRLKAWNAIASSLCPGEDHDRAVTRLSKQFSDLKQAYFSRRQSTYHEQLSFLAPMLDECNKSNPSNKEIFDSNQKVDEQWPWADSVPPEMDDSGSQEKDDNNMQSSTEMAHNDDLTVKREFSSNPCLEQVSKQNSAPQRHIEMPASAKSKCHLQLENTDEDDLFLLSLANEIKTVPPQFQLSFRGDLLSTFTDLIEKYSK